ncbi:hypothetical protein SADUNF_Sadunf02G0017100 [Salix dunnii]|uniref:Uncharacterized protein n=1 Tax=Salix dunnii TaxID=1413687 RepID=A0A835N5J0_9ROSI|nr:hypothetical protein SADUNF_Sadunf02G0017100 [Salix dunnii]
MVNLHHLISTSQVIYFTDQVVDYLMQYVMDYQDKKFHNVFEEGLKLGKVSKAKELEESFKELTKWWKSALARENVDDVRISNVLDDTACVADDCVKQTAQLMYQMALMENGLMLNNPNEFASCTCSSVKSRLRITEPAKDDDEDTEPSAVQDELEIT